MPRVFIRGDTDVEDVVRTLPRRIEYSGAQISLIQRRLVVSWVGHVVHDRKEMDERHQRHHFARKRWLELFLSPVPASGLKIEASNLNTICWGISNVFGTLHRLDDEAEV